MAILSTPSNDFMEADGDFLRKFSVTCPECQSGFSTLCLIDLPPVCDQDIIEADLHRVLPDSEMRGALVTVCPFCNHASWTVAFKRSGINPDLMPEAHEIESSKKFALAVKVARAKNINPLEIAFIAMNGLYAVREAKQSDELWVELAAYEQYRGITQETLIPPSPQDHLIMAELWRQCRQFEKAVAEYDLAAADPFIPKELISHQKMLCQAGDYTPTVLPPYIVRLVFPEAESDVVEVQRPRASRRKPAPTPEMIAKVSQQYAQALAAKAAMRRPAAVQADPQSEPASSVTGAQPAEVLDHFPPAVATQMTPTAEVPPAPVDPALRAPQQSRPIQGIAMPQASGGVSLVQASHNDAMQVVLQATERPVSHQHELVHETPHLHQQKRHEEVRQHKSDDRFPEIHLTDSSWENQSSTPSSSNELIASARSASEAHRRAQEGQRVSNSNTNSNTNPYADDYHQDNDPQPQQPQNQYYVQRPPAPSQVQEVAAMTDEDLLYDNSYVAENPNPYVQQDEYRRQQEQQQAQAQPAQSGQPAQSTTGADHSEAIAQVESFLNLTRQPSYQNWIRGYRTN